MSENKKSECSIFARLTKRTAQGFENLKKMNKSERSSNSTSAHLLTKLWAIYECLSDLPRDCVAQIIVDLFESSLFMSGVRIGKSINGGTYGQILEVKGHNDLVAKRCYDVYDFVIESIIMFRLRHYSNLTHIYGLYYYDSSFYIIIRRETNSIRNIMSDAISAELLKKYLPKISYDLFLALLYIHSRGLIHRDIHPGNVFITCQENGEFKAVIGDFGLATLAKNRYMQYNTGVPGFVAPEKRFSYKSDVYALGCIIFFIYTGQKYAVGLLSTLNISKNFYDFLSGILHEEPEKRMCVKDALASEYLKI